MMPWNKKSTWYETSVSACFRQQQIFETAFHIMEQQKAYLSTLTLNLRFVTPKVELFEIQELCDD